MNTTENNKLLAEFMGVFDKIKQIGDNYYWSDSPFYFTSENTKEKVIENISKYLKYDTSWNDLMQIVEKIESLDYNFNITSKDATALMNHSAIYQTLIYRIDGTTKIEAVYNTCVEFVKWYNSSKEA